ncbi:MAG TPA: hypothetical protein VGD42_02825, partial [Lysobacter sp.]
PARLARAGLWLRSNQSVPFFDQAKDGLSKNPRATTRRIGRVVKAGPFFGYFLWASKESDPPQGGSF